LSQNPVSVSKLLQPWNGSPIAGYWQAKPAVTVKFELILKGLCILRPSPSGSLQHCLLLGLLLGLLMGLPLDFWPPNLDIGRKSKPFE
jgi:hypothetical protein